MAPVLQPTAEFAVADIELTDIVGRDVHPTASVVRICRLSQHLFGNDHVEFVVLVVDAHAVRRAGKTGVDFSTVFSQFAANGCRHSPYRFSGHPGGRLMFLNLHFYNLLLKIAYRWSANGPFFTFAYSWLTNQRTVPVYKSDSLLYNRFYEKASPDRAQTSG